LRANLKSLIFLTAAAGAAGIFLFALALRPAAPAGAEFLKFTVSPGDGFWETSARLEAAGIIRSAFAFRAIALASGAAPRLKPGEYLLNPAAGAWEIISELVAGANREVRVTIPDGASVYLIDKILSDAGVLEKGKFQNYVFSLPEKVEGRLFPDTYRFFSGSSPAEVFRKLSENFAAKALPVLSGETGLSGSGAPGPDKAEENLILASLLEKEVPDGEERRIVAGILLKRLAAGVPLQVDAAICYVKQRLRSEYVPCYPLSPDDFKLKSAYNTYLNRGLPPGPIGSPGLDAIRAAMSPVKSPYWYYLSDPATGKTIFAETLEEHAANRARYLRL
jgi:UPF0755 protein